MRIGGTRTIIDMDILQGLYNVADMFKAALVQIEMLEAEIVELRKQIQISERPGGEPGRTSVCKLVGPPTPHV